MTTDKDRGADKPVKKPGVLSRLYSGETTVDFIKRRMVWYGISLLLMLVSLSGLGVAIGSNHMNWGIEFVGGTQFQGAVKEGVSLTEVEAAVEADGVEVVTAQTAGTGDDATVVVRTESLPNKEQQEIQQSMSEALGGEEVSISNVSESWGASVSTKAYWALGVSLALIMGYLWWRYERKMAIAAILALIHDLILTAGIYAIVGFEITPSTVIGMLTILGYSLYDTVVVFDKVHENTRGVLSQQRYTYGESANLAINQTLMRSINTTLIGLLPVGGLLFVGAGLLGVGTLKDLALVLFVGMATGAYSSLFLATPLLVDFKLREKDYKTHTRKVLARRAETGESAESIVAEPDHDADEDDTDKADTRAETVEEEPEDAEDTEERKSRPKALSNASAPRPGARSGDNKRPTGARKKKRR